MQNQTCRRAGWLAAGLLMVGSCLWIGTAGTARGQVGPPPTPEELRGQHAALVKFLGNASVVDLYLDSEALRRRAPSVSRVYPQRLERIGSKVFLVLSVGGSGGVETLMIDSGQILAITRGPIP